MFYSTDRSKAVVPVLALLFVDLWFIPRGDLLYVLPCAIFSPYSIAITSLGEERANLSAFRTFDRFVLVWICQFPLCLVVWKGLRFACEKVCDALFYILDYIFIRFGTKLYRQTIGIPMGTNCAPLVADFFFFVMREIS